jgi:sugar O-acyltransferase (sialic acid O-acetyltransferase NeuD family)
VCELVLIGGGGHATSCLDVIGDSFRIAGILEQTGYPRKSLLGVPVIGTDEDIPRLVKEGFQFLIAIGQIDSPEPRRRLFCRLKSLGASLPVIVGPTAQISPHATIGEGSIVMNMAVIGPGVKIGANCIVNTRALLEHDVIVDDHSHVSTGALINGGCTVGSGVFIGSGVVVRDGVSIGCGVFIPMGARVTRDVSLGRLKDEQGRKNCYDEA